MAILSPDITIHLDVEVPMSDGVVLRADVYLPRKQPAPTLISRTPYMKASLPGLMAVINPVRAAHMGFAVIVQDVRGRGSSGGEFEPFVNEAGDGAETVRWAARQDWCNGRIGLFGSSYMGATQLQAAAEQPEGLKSICPIQAVSDYHEGRSYRGGAFELGALTSISLWNLGAGTLLRAKLDPRSLRERFASAREALSDLSSFLSVAPYDRLREGILGELAPFLFGWWENDRADASFWSAIRIADRYHRITVPALHVTGWFDQFHVGAIRNYEGLRKKGQAEAVREGQKLVIGPWAHYPPKSSLLGAVKVGDVDFGLEAFIDLEALQLSWFRHWLAEPDQPQPGSRVRIFVMGRNVWRDEPDWPLERACETPLYLKAGEGEGQLDWTPDALGTAARFTFDPADPMPTLGGAHLVLESAFPQGPVAQNDILGRPDILLFQTAVLEEELEVTGWVSAELWVRSSAPATDFTVKLVDVWPDGTHYNVCDGIRRLRPGEIDPDGWTPIIVEMGATSQAFLPSHRIAIHISSSSYPRFDIASNTLEPARLAAVRETARQQVSVGGEHPSRLLLPIVPPDEH